MLNNLSLKPQLTNLETLIHLHEDHDHNTQSPQDSHRVTAALISPPSSASSRNHSQMDSSSPAEEDTQKAGDVTEDNVERTRPKPGKKRKGASRNVDSSAPSKSQKDCATKGPTNTRSWVWEHYTRLKDNKNKCTCNYCGQVMACSSANGTTCLGNHLGICRDYKTWLDTTTKGQHTLNPVGDNGNIKLSKVSEDVVREATNEMLVLAELPLSFTESLAWHHFCTRVNLPKPHSRRTATRDIVELYVKKKEALIKVIRANNQRISLTTDIWVAPTTAASYMVITAHFLDGDWKLRKFIIGFKNISDHKGRTICSVLLQCLAEWGIKKIFTITVDNATANTSALRKFKDAFMLQGNDALVLGGEYMHLRCCAHIINLVVNDGLHDLSMSVAAIRNAVQYVRSSTPRLEAFEQKVESGKMTRGSLSLDCKTRWNSTYLMLTRALKYKLAFDKMKAEDKLYNDYFVERVEGKTRIGPPTKEDWDEVERLVNFLVIFYNSTLVVSASTSASSFKVYNEVVTIERNLIALSKNSDEKLKEKAQSMIEKFDKYWDGLRNINKLLIIASVFDPRNKMKFASLCFDKLYGKDSEKSKGLLRSVNRVLKDLFEEYNRELTRAGNLTSNQSHLTDSQGGQDQVASDFFDKMAVNSAQVEAGVTGVTFGYERMDNVYDEIVSELSSEDASTELELYLKEKVLIPKPNPLGITHNVLDWWKANSPKYPVLAAIARDILAMQVSSVASEAAFSTSKRILEPSRSCLTHYMVETLMCTEQWLKCEIHKTDKGVITTQQLLDDIELQDKLQKEFESQFN